jgi:polyisoprenoid-binding protein YceI
MEARTAAGQPAAQPEDDQRLLPAGRWDVVADESVVGFRVKKLGLYYVKGRFTDVRGRIDAADAGDDVRGEVVIKARSVTTRMPPRDLHLRTRDFLAVKRHPEIRITADGLRRDAQGGFVVPATFEIRGERKPVELTAHRHADEHAQHQRLHLSGTLHLEDFGIRPLPPQGLMVGADVHLDVHLVLRPGG